MAAGVQLEHRYHLGRGDGEMPTRFWVAPRAGVAATHEGGRFRTAGGPGLAAGFRWGL